MILATWNLMHPASARRRAAIREHTDRVAADVWVLTETHDAFTPGHPHSHSSSPGRDGDYPSEHRWVTIWSTYPLQPLDTPDAERTAAARLVPDSAEPFIVFGTVLPWLGSTWRSHAATGGTAFREALRLQVEAIKRLTAAYPDDQVFLLGDLNQDLVEPPYYGSRANRAELQAGLQTAGLWALTGGAGDPVRRLSPPCACIDHICCRPDKRCTFGIPFRWPDLPAQDRRLTDHFGVGVHVTW